MQRRTINALSTKIQVPIISNGNQWYYMYKDNQLLITALNDTDCAQCSKGFLAVYLH